MIRYLLISMLLLATLTNTGESSAQDRAFSIPLLDLNDQSDRQTIVDREEGQYLGHPTTLLLEDQKTILCVYPQGHGKGPIIYRASSDGGRTWSDRLPTPASWATSQETPTIHRVIDALGVKRVILFSGLYPIRMSVSEDDGRNWSELKAIGPWGGIVAMGSVTPMTSAAGHYLAHFHDDGRFYKNSGKATGTFTLYQAVSRDGGVTWEEPTVVYKSAEVHLCEPGVVRSPDGKQLAMLLRENRRIKNSHVMFSSDEGLTWSEPRELPLELTGDRHTAKYADDGRLFISFRDVPPRSASSPTAGDWVGWLGRYEDIVAGNPGQYRIRFKDNTKGFDCAYPGVEVLADGSFVTTTYGHWEVDKPPFILSVRFHPTELDKIAQP